MKNIAKQAREDGIIEPWQEPPGAWCPVCKQSVGSKDTDIQHLEWCDYNGVLYYGAPCYFDVEREVESIRKFSESLDTPEKAKRFLIDAGIYDEEGNLTPPYRS